MNFFIRYFLLLTIYFAFPKQALTQTHFIDSLELVLKQSNRDSDRVFAFIDLAKGYYNYDTLKAARYL